MFYKYAHILGPKGSPDMIPSAFDVKFDEKKDEIPPGACRPSKKQKKNNVEQVDPQKVEKQLCRKSGPPKSRTKTMSKKWAPRKLEKKQCRTGSDQTGFKQEPDRTGF